MKIQQSLGYLLNVSARLIKRNLDVKLKFYGITTAQWAVLKLLSVNSDLSQAEIAESLNSDRATCGTILEKLIAKRLIEKELSKNDRRSYRVKILPTSVAIVSEVTIEAEKLNCLALKGLSNNDIKALEKCLDVIISNLGGEIDVMEI